MDPAPLKVRNGELGELHLVCSKCTREAFFFSPLDKPEIAVKQAKACGWTMRGQAMQVVCPKCP